MRLLRTILSIWLSSVALGRSASSQIPPFADLRRTLPWDLSGENSAVALGDVDGDGDLDAFVTGLGDPYEGPSARRVRLYLNEASGAFRDASFQVPSIPLSSRAVALGDVDGDGDIDAWIGAGNLDFFGGQQDRLFLNDGTGSFSDGTSQVPPESGSTAAVVLGDVDGDGDLDAVLGNDAPAGILLFLNDGAGGLVDASGQVAPTVGPTKALALGDVDADGDLDLLRGSSTFPGGTCCSLLINDGAGGFLASPNPLPVVLAATESVSFGDVDGDGDLDIGLATYGCGFLGCYGPPLALLLNDGAGGFQNASAALPTSDLPGGSLRFFDAEGDGDLDVVLAGKGWCLGFCNPSTYRLYLNDGTATFTDGTAQLPVLYTWPRSLAAGDVDADGDADLVLGVGYFYQPCRLYLNDGSGHFTDVTSTEDPSTPSLTAFTLGDVDGDGDLDLVGAEVLYNDGRGVFGPGSAGPLLPPGPDTPSAFALGDLDADGDVDVLATVSTSVSGPANDRLFLNLGDGTFADASSQLPSVLDHSSDVALGDVDGDGDLDALIGNEGPCCTYQGDRQRLYLNDGQAIFVDASDQLPGFSDATNVVALADVDADGDLDAVIGNAGFLYAQPDRLYLNDGTGTFSYAAGYFPSVSDFTVDLAVGDVDGDGDLDLLAANAFGTAAYAIPFDRLYLNDGSGHFSDATSQLPSNPGRTHAVGLVDVEDDGDLDALIGRYDFPNRLYLNDGAGIFSDATDPATYIDSKTAVVAIGDIDGDGDSGAVVNDIERIRPLFNLTRQLAWRGPPRLGKPLTLDIHGPAWGAWFLLASLGAGSLALPPFGVARLDLGSVIPLQGGLLDGQGHVAVTYSVPPTLALVGGSLYWQALVVGPAKLTNFEVTTFTSL
jgi:hypothetical protein